MASEYETFNLQIIKSDELAKMRRLLTDKVIDKQDKLPTPNTQEQLNFAEKIVSERIGDFLDLFDAYSKEENRIEVVLPRFKGEND